MSGKPIAALRGLLFNNKGVKLVSMLLAIVTWYAIQKALSFETVVRDVPVKIYVDEGWAILDRSDNTVDVLFSGSQDAIRTLTREHTEVELDIRGKPYGGTLVVPLQAKHVRALGGVRAIQIRPPEITLSLDQEGEKPVPVKVDIAGEPPVGHEVEDVVCTPASAVVHGPRQRLADIDAVRTAPIDLEGRVRSFKLRTPVSPPSDRWVARIEPDSVIVDVTLVERSASTELKDVRVCALINPDLAPKARLWPGKVDVVLKGRSDLIDNLAQEDIHAYVSCTGLEPTARYELPVRVHAPAGITIDTIEPATIRVDMGEF